jgi:hypothetical protein
MVPGPGMYGFYHCGDGGYLAADLLRLLLDWGLLEVFGVEVLDEMTGRAATSICELRQPANAGSTQSSSPHERT